MVMENTYLLKQGSRGDYNYKEYYVETADEIQNIEINEDICPGSVVFVITTSQVFMLNTKKEWVLI